MNWHQLNIEEVFKLTGSSQQGLSSPAVEQKLVEYGPNELQQKKARPAWVLFIAQFNDFMILVLTVAAVVSGFFGDLADTIIILLIVLINAIVGFIQEYRANKALAILQKMATPFITVIRNGQPVIVSAVQLVPGDLVMLEAGTVGPADLRLTESHALRVDESSLTGESMPVDKTADVIAGDDLPLGDRFNMVYKSTQVTNGRGTGIVIATGMNTEIGQVARLLEEETPVTPLQKRMAAFSKKLSYLIILICIVLFGIGLLRGEEPIRMLLTAISLAVAAIPEALPALITIALARGASLLVKKNVLIRKLPAVETLGSVTYICTDKTGTLTQNKMKVVEVQSQHDSLPGIEFSPVDYLITLNHDVQQTQDGSWLGDPTEIALMEYIHEKYGMDQLTAIQLQFPRVAELPFDSDRKCMTTIHRYNDGFIAVSKGAVESILNSLQEHDLDDAITQQTNKMAAGGLRVLAYSYRLLDQLPHPFNYSDIETDLLFGGLAGMIDPPRVEVKAAIQQCHQAGINTVMITGDHPETAAAIAREIGILTNGGRVITGSQLNRLTSGELDGIVESVRVYARVSPEQKLNIVRSLQRKKHFVAMTGDGVNDAPSLKTANIGIAMGINGTDVSREAAHMILLDDNFATIVKAVHEGRRIYDNIRRFVKYIMTCNSAELLTIFLAPFFGLPVPLLPVHILWINLVTDGLPGLALSAEKAEKNSMLRPPRQPDESLFAGGMSRHIIWVGLLMAMSTLGLQAWAIYRNDTHWQTMVFTILSLSQLGHAFAVRSDYEFIFRKGFFSNPFMLLAIGITFALQLLVIYLPAANRFFSTQPLSLNELLICILVSSIVFHAVEIEKWVKARLSS